jgi:hypothetical protein
MDLQSLGAEVMGKLKTFLLLLMALPLFAQTEAIPTIRYAGPFGLDTNDGATWATAKFTVTGALQALPGGGPGVAGSGTVYVSGGGTQANALGPLYGIWLMNSLDPNFATPPAGWLQCDKCTGEIVGVQNQTGGPNGHKARAFLISGNSQDRNMPSIWLSGMQQSYTFRNLELIYPARAVVLGECSNNDRTGKCGVSGKVFENVSAIIYTGLPSNGPCTDMVSNVFWVWLRDYGCGGMGAAAAGGITADNAAAILIDASQGSGSGLIYINDTNISGGGIKVKLGVNGGGLYAKNVIEEGDYVHPAPPVVWFTSWCAFCDAILENIQNADSGAGTMPTIETDISSSQASIGPTVINSSGIAGPAVLINPLFGVNNLVASPLRQRQTGFVGRRVYGDTDVARRIAGVVPVRFKNLVYADPSTWSVIYSDPAHGSRGILKTGVADPFGGTFAGTATSLSAASDPQVLQFGGCSSYTPVAGDWIVVGLWAANVGPSYTYPAMGCYGYPAPLTSEVYDSMGYVGDGQWNFQWRAYKISGGPPTLMGLTIHMTVPGGPITVYGPNVFVIPAGTLTDNEVLEFAASQQSVDIACPVGSLCPLPGHAWATVACPPCGLTVTTGTQAKKKP